MNLRIIAPPLPETPLFQNTKYIWWRESRRLDQTYWVKARDIIARNVRQRRAELGLSQDELGARAGSSGNYIGMIERSEVSVSVDMLEDTADVLGIAVRDLVDMDWRAGSGLARQAKPGLPAARHSESGSIAGRRFRRTHSFNIESRFLPRRPSP